MKEDTKFFDETKAACHTKADDWGEREDPITGRKYFINRITKKTTWHKPGSSEDAAMTEEENLLQPSIPKVVVAALT